MKRFDYRKLWILSHLYAVFALLSIFTLAAENSLTAQISFTNIAGTGADDSNIPGSKDGGASFEDYDLDGDLDLLVNTHDQSPAERNYLLRNDNGTFTDVSSIAPGLKTDEACERTAAWGDCNNDGYPDMLINTNTRLKILLSDFGASFTTILDITAITDGMNTEGAGWIDYDMDGDLDFFVENHNHGVDMFQNNGAASPTFTQVTVNATGAAGTGAGGLGLPEGGSYTGDYGTSTDLNADGYPDLLVRRENNGTNNGADQNSSDIFINNGDGTFTANNSMDEAAENSNKGAVLSGDFDNDGDLDILWTSSSSSGNLTVIYENTGFNSMVFNLVSNVFFLDNGSAEISTDFDGCAVGDIDNDGDLDIFMTQNSGASKLFLNKSTGAGNFNFRQAGPISEPGAALNYGIDVNGNGEGCVMADFDNDGDVDLYVNKTGQNQLWQNNYIGSAEEASAAYQDNYLKIIALRDLGGGGTRSATNATVRFLDCDGQPIGPIREIGGGGAGHGSQTSPWLHLGLPDGPDESYIIEVKFTRNGVNPVTVRKAVIPSLLPVLSMGSSGLDLKQTLEIKDTDSDSFTSCLDTDNDGIIDVYDLDDDNDGILDVDEGKLIVSLADLDQVSPIPAGTYPGIGTSDGLRLSDATGYLVLDIYKGTNTSLGEVILFNTTTGQIQGSSTSGTVTNSEVVELVYTTVNSPVPFQLEDININDIESLDVTTVRDAYVWSEPGGWVPQGTGGTGSPAAAVIGVSSTAGDNVGPVLIPDPDGSNTGFRYSVLDFSQVYAVDNTLSSVLVNMIGAIDGHTVDFAFDSPHTTASLYVFNAGGASAYWSFFPQLTFATTIDLSTDTDLDGIPDYQDLDSDGDGCADAIEGTGTALLSDLTTAAGLLQGGNNNTAGLGYNGTSTTPYLENLGTNSEQTNPALLGVPILTSTGVAASQGIGKSTDGGDSDSCIDTDGDSVTDINDLDNDNDGILDTVEGCDATLAIVPTNTTQSFSIADRPTNSVTFSGTNGGAGVISGSHFTYLEGNNIPTGNEYSFTFTDPVVDVDLWIDNIIGTSQIGDFTFEYEDGTTQGNLDFNITSANTYSLTASSSTLAEKATIGGFISIVDPSPEPGDQNNDDQLYGNLNFVGYDTSKKIKKITYTLIVRDPLNSVTGRIVPIITELYDTDNDGIANCLDLDSDGDGCDDVLEAGFTDDNGDGILGDSPITVGTSGLVTSGVDGYSTPISTNGTDYDFQIDTTPTITNCPSNQTIDADNNCEAVLADFTSIPTTTGACDILSQLPAAGSTITGVTAVTLTVTDADGDSSDCTFNVTVIDTSDPVTPTLADVTGQCSATAAAPTTTDNCDGTITGTTNDATTYSTQGTHTITWTFTDASGNSIDVDQDVVIDDTTDPVAPTLADVTGQCTATATAPTTTDNCSGTLTGTTSDALTYSTQGTHTITWTFDDGNGNVITVDQDVVIDDTTDPVAPTLADVTGQCTATAATPTTTDNCSGTLTGTTSDATTYSTQGTHTITWTFDDGNGNVITVDQDVIIDDTIDPVVTCPANQTENFDTNCELTLPNYTGLASATDNCSSVANITLTQSPLPGTVITGNTTITITAEDEEGNTNTCTFDVTVNDTTDPAIPTLADVTGQCTATATPPTTTDNCDGTITGTTSDATTYSSQGTHTITWTFTDASGNSINVDQDVVIDDTTDPVTPTLADVTGQCTATATAPTTTDNCSGTLTGTTSDATTYSTQGTHTITWTFDDGNGNVITVDQDVVIDDTTDPVTPTLADITAECTAAAAVPTTTDACAGTVTGTTSDATTYSTQGTHVIAWTFDDGNGNVITVNQNVIITDTTDPVVACPADVTENFDAACQFTLPDYTSGASATDNCSSVANITFTQSPTAGTVITGNTVITITAEDEAGNTDTCIFDVTVEDNIDPTLTTQDVTIQLDASGSASITPTDVTDATADNCGTPTVTVDQTTFDCSEVGANTVNVTSTDDSGNAITETATVTVEDNVNPTAVCLDITIGLDGSGNATITAADIDGGSSDNCGIASLVASQTSFTSADLGPNNVTLTVTDVNGNTDTCTSVVTVSDSNPPNAVCQDITIALDASGNVSIVAADIDGGSTDNGVIVSITASQTDFDCSHVGTNLVTLTVTDDAGNTDTCIATVIVEDNIDPTLTTQDVTIQLDGTGSASITAADVTDVTADNCGTPTVTVDQTDFDCSEVGTNTVNVTTTDANGNSITETATVTVEDNVDPTAVCLDITIGLDGSGNATITAADIDGGSSDNCGIASLVASQTSFTSADLGPNNVTLTVTDVNGNTDTCTSVVTVSDSNPPNAVCQDITIALDASGNVSIVAADIDGGSTDNGVIVSITASQTDFDCSHVGTNSVTLTVTDDAGNTDTCIATVIVEDNIDPTLTTQDVTIQLDGTGSASITAADVTDVTADNCGTPTVTVDQTDFDCSEVGTNTVNVTTTDANGNSITETATVTVEDNVDPTAVCLDITIGLDGSGNATITAADIDGGSSDNCGIASLVASQTSFTSADLGPNNVTLTVTDVNGNTDTCTSVVTVSDSNPPNAVCQDITIALDASGNVSIVAADIDGGSTDNGVIVSITASQTDFDCSHVGTNSVTLTVTDDAGNTDTCVATVTVEDNIAPTLITQDVTIQLDGTGSASITPADVTDATADNCGTPTVTVDQTTFDCSEVGTNTVNVTTTDANGNAVTETATVTVEDNVDPTAVCLDITVGLDGSGNATITPADVDGGSTDNCGIASLSASVTSFTSADLGPNNVTLTVTDDNGNTATCTAVVTVSDSNPPIAVCQDITVQLDATGNVSITAADIDGGSTDNGTIVSITASQTAFDCSHVGANNVTLTVTDDAGNTNTCVATVTVEDNTNPTLTTQDVTIQLDGSGAASITPAAVTAVTADNCGTPTVTADQTTFDCSQVGANTVNVTATDASGNTVTETATVTVEDIEDPTAVCLDITVGLDGSGNATITASDIDGGSTDNCGAVTLSASQTAFTSADLGPNNVTLTVTDANGNTATCTAVVTVSDSNPPTAVCQDITVQLDATGNISITAADIDNGSTDNGVITSITVDQTAFDCTHVGANTVTLTVTDDAGNSSTCTATVTVEDNTNPTLTTQDVTIQLDGSGAASITPAAVTAVTADNCGTPTVTADQTTFDCSQVGANTVNVTATDASGNAVTETATVTVEDSELPTANCQDITVGLDGSGNATITASDIDGGSTDNCGAVTLSASQTAFTSADLGPNNVTLTVTDANGNTATCTAVVTVSDSNPPTAVCQDITVQLDATGNISITAADIDNGSTDNGVITSITVDQTAFDCSHVGANNVTLTVTDDAGNTNTCVATVTVEDNIDPTLTTQNVTVQLDGSGAASITPADVTNTTADNCGTPTVTVDQTTFDCSQVGANTVNVTATDASGNTVTETATVTVEDIEDPTAVCLDITVGLDGSGNATITASAIDGGSSDNCGAVTLSASQTAFTSADLGPNNVTLTVTDANGNTATCTAVVTVSDSNPPTAVCQDITVQPDATGNVSITAADIDGGSTDNGTIVSMVASQTDFDCSHVGANNVTLTVTDDAGNTNTCVATVTVEDNTNPTLTTQNVTVQLDGSGAASITSADVTNTTADNCGVPTVTVDQTTFNCSQVGANTVNVTATDASGNTVTETATVTVEDNELPTAVCLDITVGLDGSGNATITALDIDGGSTDNCAIASMTASVTAFTSADLGPNNVTLTVTDANGNTATCTAVVTVSDSNPPTAVCQDITVQLDATGNVSITAADIDGGSTDNGTIVSITASQTAFDCSHVGANNVTLTVTDDAGNTNTCVATVTVEDNTNPTLTTQDVTIQLDGSGAASITPAAVTAVTADNCGTPTVTADQTTFDCSQVGANTVNVTATDASGNTVTETATVTVEDIEDPTAVCLDITVGLDGSGNATITASDIDGGSTDNCGAVTLSASQTAFTSADLGPNNVTLTVTDANGNTATCTAVVTVSDSNPPTAVCQDITVQLDATGNVSITAADIDGGSTDNGTIVSMVASQTDFDCSHVGANNVTLTVTDDAGNTNTCVATVTVEDNTNPTLTTQNVTVQLDGSGAASITAANVTNTTADNCGTPTVTVDQTTFDCSQVGANTVNVTATDASGNTVTETATVTVEDNELPTAVCLDITVGLDGSGNATITALDIDGGSTDNCAIASMTASVTAFTSADLGPNNVTLTVTDANGNTATCTAVVTVSDSNPPTAVCQDITVQLDATGNVSITAADIDGGSTDNGTIVSITASQTAFDCSHVGANNVTLTVTDDAGNTNTCVATVTVEDNTNPTLTTQDVTIQLDGSGAASITPAAVTAVTADNCGTPTVTADQTTFDCSQVGANTVNVTATDASGNTVTETATVTVEDIEDPTAVCLDITVGLDGSGNATITASDIDGGSTDNCGAVTLSASQTAFTSADLGPNNVTLTVTDANGNTATCTAVVTVSDSNPPTAVCQDITVQLDATGNVSITAADIDGGSTDNGTIVSMVASQTAFDCSHVGANNVTITVTDDAGNTNTCVATVTVEDNTNPTLTTQDVTIQLDGSGAASITPAAVTAVTADNCGTPTVTADQTTFDCSQVGANTVNVTATDASGNTVTETATVTVEDNELPTANCQDITVGLDVAGNATITASAIDGGSSDNCGAVTLSASQTAFTSADLGPNNVTLTVTDANGNTATCTAVVTVSDSNPPTAVCQDITVQLDAAGNVSIVAADIDGGSTDNGLITSIIASQTAFDCTDLGANSVTLTVTDDAGNTNTCVATVTVEDNINPTLTTQDVTIQLDASGAASIVAADVTNTTADNCGTPTVTVDQTTFDCSQVGANTVNVTATDASGNTVTETATVTVEDNELPTAVCLDITVGLDGSGNATITGADVDGGSSDNCAIATLNVNPNNFTNADLGANTVTLTVTDVHGNISDCQATVTIADNSPPTAICQDITIQLDATGNVSIVAADIDGGSTDNGVIASLVASQTAFDCSNLGVNTVTLTVTDNAGNQSNCNANVTVEDTIPPTLTTQDVIIEIDAGGQAILTPEDVTTSTADNCGVPTVTIENDTFDCNTVGENEVNVYSTDSSGNVTTEIVLVTVTVIDNIPPVAVCADITVGTDENGNASITAADVDGGSYDNCSIAGMTVTPNSFTSADLGPNTVTLTVTDVNSNVSTCEAVVTVADVTPPTAVCQDITVELGLDGTVTILAEELDGGSIDNAGSVSFSASQLTFDCSDLGTVTVTLTVTDDSGNTSSCESTVTVLDAQAPVITECPIESFAFLNEDCIYEMEDFIEEMEYYDNCTNSNDIQIEQTPAPGTVFSGMQSINCTIILTDNEGNSDKCEFTVVISDITSPIIECPSDVTAQTDVNCEYMLEDFIGQLVMLDCDSDLTVFQSPIAGTVLSGSGTTQDITLTATDSSGNESSCTFLITLEDSVSPEVFCIGDQEVNTTENCTAVLPDYLDQITAFDSCGETTIIQEPAPGTVISEEVTQVTITASDINGNTQECSFNVQLVDNIPPVVDCLANINVANDVGICGAMVTYEFPTATDNCAVESIELTAGLASGELFPIGENLVEITTLDLSGNVTVCTFNVIVTDEEAPEITCPEGQILEALENCSGVLEDYSSMLLATDNCDGDLVITQSPEAGTVIFSDQLVTLRATDASGNLSECEINVLLIDTTAPIIECADDIEQVEALVNYSMPEATDNCEVELLLVEGLDSGDEFPHGITPVVYMARDGFGNTDTCSFTVLINTPPVGVNDSLFIESHLEDADINVILNDYDPDGDVVILTDAWTSSDSTEVFINDNGEVEYIIYDGWCGIDVVTYTICDGYGACAQAQLVIEVECFNGINVPEGFSPNGDGVNDTFTIPGILNFPDSRLQIFNRWGREVYDVTGYNNDWDGTSHTSLDLGEGNLPQGTYFVILDLGDGSEILKSYIYLNY